MVLVDTLGGQTSTPGEDPGTTLLPFELQVARGVIPGVSPVVIRGHIVSAAAVAGFVDVSEIGTTGNVSSNLTYITSAQTLEVVASSTDDTGVGNGLNTVLLQGVDASGTATQEIITLNGTTDVLTTNKYFRVNSLVGLTSGSTGWNVSGVRVSSDTSGIQLRMDKTESLSQGSHYTVPKGKTLFITQVEFNIAQGGAGQAPEVEFKIYARPGGVEASAAWVQFFDKKMDVASQNELIIKLPFPSANNQAIAKTDVRVRIDTDQDATEARTRMYGYLIDD